MSRSTRKIRVKALWAREITALREEFNKLVNEVAEIKTSLAAHTHPLEDEVQEAVSGISARLEELVTKVEGHTHGGITAGAGTSSAMAAMALTNAAATLAAEDSVTEAPAAITYANEEAALIG